MVSTLCCHANNNLIRLNKSYSGPIFNYTQSGMEGDLEKIRDLTSLYPHNNLTTLTELLPTGILGDQAFGYWSNVKGSSIAENNYNIHNLNVTDKNKLVEHIHIPLSFIKRFEIITTDISPQYGLASGAIVNAETFSGGDQFKAGLSIDTIPGYFQNQNRSMPENTIRDETKQVMKDINLFVSGPIIPESIRFILMSNPNHTNESFVKRSNQINTKTKEGINSYLGKIDLITKYIDASFMHIKSMKKTKALNIDEGGVSRDSGSSKASSKNNIINMKIKINHNTHLLIDRSTVDDHRQPNEVDKTEQACYYIDSGRFIPCGNWINWRLIQPFKQRAGETMIKLDVNREHLHTTVGFEQQKSRLTKDKTLSGGSYNLWFPAFEKGRHAYYISDVDWSNDKIAVRIRDQREGGTFRSKINLAYINEHWQPSRQLAIELGARAVTQEQTVGDGTSRFTKFRPLVLPRVSLDYLIGKELTHKLFASYSSMTQTMPSDLAFRYASSYFKRETYYEIDKSLLRRNITQEQRAQLKEIAVIAYADGTIPDHTTVVAQNLRPQIVDNIQLGYTTIVNPSRFNMRFYGMYIHKRLSRGIEDVAIDRAMINYCSKNNLTVADGGSCGEAWAGFNQYVIANPGYEVIIRPKYKLKKADGSTHEGIITLSAEDLQYPKMKRSYDGLVFTLSSNPISERLWMNGSYAYSKTRGNTEGIIKSDIEQHAPMSTQDFDSIGLTEGSFGLLPQHRWHVLKLFATYRWYHSIFSGARLNIQSPRYFGCLGFHPTDEFAYRYGNGSFYCNGILTPRGSQFKSNWLVNTDLHALWNVSGNMSFTLDIFNLFNRKAAVDKFESGEYDGVGRTNFAYKYNTALQPARNLKISFGYKL